MLTQNSQSKQKASQTNLQALLTPEALSLLEFIQESDPEQIALSLRRIHDTLLYFTEFPIGIKEKNALLDVNRLSMIVGRMPLIDD